VAECANCGRDHEAEDAARLKKADRFAFIAEFVITPLVMLIAMYLIWRFGR
jgi:hypothetical protein